MTKFCLLFACVFLFILTDKGIIYISNVNKFVTDLYDVITTYTYNESW